MGLHSIGAVTCILNGAADSHAAGAAEEHVAGLFKANGAEAQILVAKVGSQIPILARQAREKGASIIVAAGGDGTVNAVAQVLINTNTSLGVLPLGTLNHFAKDLGIPLTLEAAISNVLTGAIVRVDVGEVNGRPFLNNSSLGLYPAIVRQREDGQKNGHGKWLAFATATFNALWRYPRLYVRLQPDGQSEIDEETPFVFIGNNEYQVRGLNFGKRARLDAGRLWVYSAPRASRAALVRLALHALRGRHDPSELKIFDVEEFCIRVRRKHIQVATDGEVHTLEGPLNYRILPKALNVVVPTSPGTGFST